MRSSVVPLHSLAEKDNQNEMEHDIFGHVKALMPVPTSQLVNITVNDTIAFLKSR